MRIAEFIPKGEVTAWFSLEIKMNTICDDLIQYGGIWMELLGKCGHL